MKLESLNLIKKNLWVYIGIILISFIYYGNSLNNGYAIDDHLVTSTDQTKHELTSQGIKAIPKIFKTHFVVNSKQKYSYRPITTTSFAIEESIFGESENRPAISHFINISLYCLAGILLFNLLTLLFNGDKKTLTYLTVVIFLIHPIHTEVVNNIKSRDELLVMCLGLWSIITLIKYYDRQRIHYIISTAVLILLAALSKKTGLVFFALGPLCLFFFRDIPPRKILNFIGLSLIPVIVFLIMNKTMTDDTVSRSFLFFENPLYLEGGFASRLAMFFFSSAYYIVLLIFPYPLRFYYGYDQVEIVGFSDWQFWISAIFIIALLYIAYKGLKEKKLLSFSILFYFFAVGGACNLIFPVPGIIAERFAFVASIGFAFGLSFLILKLTKTEMNTKLFSRPIIIIGLILIIPTLIYTRDRNEDWKNKITLYRNDIKVLQKSAKANSLLASEYYIMFNQNLAKNGLLNIEQDMKYADSAFFYFNRAISIFPDYASCHSNLASVYFMAKLDYFKGVKHGEIATSIDTLNHEARFNLSTNYAEIANGIHYLKKIGHETGDSTLMISQSKLEFGVLNALRNKYILNFLPQYLSKNQKAGAIKIIKYVTSLDGKEDSLSNDSFAKKLISGIQESKSGKYLQGIFDLFDKKLYEYCSNGANISLDELFNEYKSKSIASFEKTIQLVPEFKNAYKSIFNYLLAWNDYELFIEWNKKYLKVLPKKEQSSVYINLGNAFLNTGNKEKAKENFDQAISIMSEELNTLNSIQNRSLEQNQRIAFIKNEIKKLQSFLKNQGIVF